MLQVVKRSLSPSLALATVALAVLGASMASGACGTAKHPGSLVIGLETDVSVPANVDGIGISIGINGQIKYSRLFALDQQLGLQGKRVVKLPATIAVVEPTDGSAPAVDIRAVAFHQGQARIVRDVVSTVPHGRTALLRLPLAYLGYNDGVHGTVPVTAFEDVKPKRLVTIIHPEDNTSDAGLDADLITNIDSRCTALQHLTNVDGECVDSFIDSNTLPDYDEKDLFENGEDEAGESNPEACFDMERCFALSASWHVNLNKSNDECTAKFDGSPDDINVAMALVKQGNVDVGFCVGVDATGADRCMVPLDRDDAHGFRVDAARGVVLLPKGVCERTTLSGVWLARASGCASKSPLMPIDGAGANCLKDGDGGADNDADADADADAEASPQVLPWHRDLSGVTSVVALTSGELAYITRGRNLTYLTTTTTGAPNVANFITDTNPVATKTAFVSADVSISVVYATFNDSSIAHVLYTPGMGFDKPLTAAIVTGLDPQEIIGLGVPQCIPGFMCFPSARQSGTFPVLAMDTTPSSQPVTPYLNAFALGVATNKTLFGTYGTTLDGGAAGTAVARGTSGSLFMELYTSGATRAFGTAAVQLGNLYRVVITEAEVDGRVHVRIVDPALPGESVDVGTIGLVSDPTFVMRNIALDDTNHYVYLTDSDGNLKYLDPYAMPPKLRNVDKTNAICAASLGVAVDDAHVFRACEMGITRDPLVTAQ